MKENDIVLNMMANPEFGIQDFEAVGLTADNTGLRTEDEYLKSAKITENDLFKDESGNFDKEKFHNFYVGAGYFYNKLAQDDYSKNVLEDAQYSQDNIWVAPEKRTIDYAPKLVRTPNEHLVNTSLTRIGKKDDPTLSDDEIAQTQKVYNIETGEWTDSPNDSFFSNFMTPLVRAQYDEDVVDENGEVIHQAGEYKLNEDGLPYYETLGGRNISGKRVLNKMNVLTKDGSFANKFDFFDSDDIEQKSTAASILKNAALVGSMFIPYVGPVVAGLSVATQTVGLLGTFGKMASNLVGADDSWANEWEGWAKSVSRQASTEYAAQNTWCWENFINLIGDSVGQLAEQRWIFKAVPTLFMGTKAYKSMSTSGRKSLAEEIATDLKSKNEEYVKTKDLVNQLAEGSAGRKQLQGYLKTMDSINESKAYHIVDDIAAKANKIGAPISKAYMVGLTVGDTYQEAKDHGASDLEAALLTIGYAAAETKLLNTELGSWILPEMHNSEFKNKVIAETLMSDVIQAQRNYAENHSKKGLVKTLVSIGNKIAGRSISEATLKAGSRAARMAGGMVTANALGESFEEVSEEVLADFSKSAFNVVRWLRGEDTIDWWAEDNITDRYLQSALGGFIGGGFASIGTDFVAAKNLASMDKTKAMQELLYMVNNNTEGDFIKTLDKITLGSKHLSAKDIIDKNNDQIVWAQGTETDNQDLEIKNVLKEQVVMLRDILNSEGARISTNSLINKLTLEDQEQLMHDMRFNLLSNSSSMGLYLQDYQNIQNDLVTVKSQLIALDKKRLDSEKESPEDKQLRSQLEEKLKDIRAKKDAYINGDMSVPFIRDAIYELNPVLHSFALKGNIQSYAKFKTGKEYDTLSDAAKKKIDEEYQTYLQTEFKDDVHAQAQMYDSMIEQASPKVVDLLKTLKNDQVSKDVLNMLNGVNKLMALIADPDTLTSSLSSIKRTELFEANLISAEDMAAVDDAFNNSTLNNPDDADYIVEVVREKLFNNLKGKLDNIIDSGYINPEVKRLILKSINTVRNQVSSLYSWDADDLIADLDSYTNTIEALPNTPVLEFLSEFQKSATNSTVDINDHYTQTQKHFKQVGTNIEDFTVDDEWRANNQEVLKLIDSFEAVVSGMRTDDADFGKLTSYSHIMNTISGSEYAEIEASDADAILQDLYILRNKFELADNLNNLNRGQKLRMQERVGTNTNHLLYKSMQRIADVVPDDDDDPEIKGGLTLKNAINNVQHLRNNLSTINLNADEKLAEAKEMVALEDAFYQFFQANSSWTSTQLGKFLNKFAGAAGFFNQTGRLLTEKSEALDDNSFIWWMAAKAAIKSSDYYRAYSQALSEDLAAIPSQETATQLGVAAITNMNVLNKFVDAYKETVVKEFKALSEADRNKYLNEYSGTSGANGFATTYLDYFAGHDSVPAYHNMIFIEGAPGTGKTFGCDRMIMRIVKQLGLNEDSAMFVHTTNKTAEVAGKSLGIKNTKGREDFLSWISSEWKDARLNKKDGKVYLYADSYEFTKDNGIVNKWALNSKSATDVPKVIFIDEISQYNQQELSMIEQFARKNQIVVITTGDLDQNVFESFVKIGSDEATVTISRNNFIRAPKQGVSLRTGNVQMSDALRATQSAIDLHRQGKDASLSYKYYENDDPGFYGVKTFTAISDSNISNTELNAIIPSIEKMVKDLADGETIGYIHSSSSPNTKLHQYLKTHYAGKFIAYPDIEAQGLEGKYYIVDIDRSAQTASQENAFLRALYTGISRAEKGVIAIMPTNLPDVQLYSSIKDPLFQLEQFGAEAIKNSSNRRKQQLTDVLNDYAGGTITITPPDASINPPSGPTPPASPTSPTSPTSPAGPTPAPMPAPITPPSPPTLPPGVFSNKADAEAERDAFKVAHTGMDTAVAKDGSGTFKISNIETVSDVTGTNFYNEVVFENGTRVLLSKFIADYDMKDSSGTILPKYTVGQQMVIQYGSETLNVKVDSVDPSTLSYKLVDLDDASKTYDLKQSDFTFMSDYVAPVNPVISETPETGFENNEDELKDIITEGNLQDMSQVEGADFKHFLYTHATFETGAKRGKNGKCEFAGGYDARIDSMIGLSKCAKSDNYDFLMKSLGILKNMLYYNSKAEAAQVVSNTYFGGKPITCEFALKSCNVGGKLSGGRYDRFHMDEDEQLEAIVNDDALATLAKGKKIVAVFKQGTRNVLEIPIATLNSPLTLMCMTLGEGELIFQDNIGGKDIAVKNVFLAAKSQGKNTYQIIDQVLDTFKSSAKLKPLMDLFKVFRYTSNGYFKLPESWEFSKLPKTGPNLINYEVGHYQLNNTLQWTPKWINLREMANHPQHHMSSIFLSKTGTISYGGNTISVVQPGHSFVLVSDNYDYTSDQELVDQYIKQKTGQTTDKSVSLFYVCPPSVSPSQWIQNIHNAYLNMTEGKGYDIYSIGNSATGYNVFRAIREYGDPDLDKLFTLGSPDSDTNKALMQAVSDLKAIETKWKNYNSITFNNANIYNGMTEEECYNSFAQAYGYERAAEMMRRREQAQYLAKPCSDTISFPGKTWSQAFSQYLSMCIWYPKTTADPKMVDKQLKALDNIDIPMICYRAQFQSAENDVGPFARAKVDFSDSYSIASTLAGDHSFKIHAKIDPPVITTDATFTNFIANVANSIYYDKRHNVWMPGKAFDADQDSYTRDFPTAKSDVDKIKDKYKKLFDNGTLDQSVLDVNMTINEALEALVVKFNKTPGQFGYYDNKHKLVLFKHPSIKYDFSNAKIQRTKGTTEGKIIAVYDPTGKLVDIDVKFVVDPATGALTDIKCCSNTWERLAAPPATPAVVSLEEIKKEMTDYYAALSTIVSEGNFMITPYLQTTFDQLKAYIEDQINTWETPWEKQKQLLLSLGNDAINKIVDRLDPYFNNASAETALSSITVGDKLRVKGTEVNVTSIETDGVILANGTKLTDFTDVELYKKNCESVNMIFI